MNDIANEVHNELAKIDQLKKVLEDSGALYDENGDIDQSLLLDMIEGETDIHELIIEVEDKIAEYDSQSEAIKIRIDKLKKRQDRVKKSSDSLRMVVLAAMDKAGIKTIKGDAATITVKRKPPALVITEESLIPAIYFESVPKLLKKDLIKDIKEGKEIEGAELDNGGISLMIKRD